MDGSGVATFAEEYATADGMAVVPLPVLPPALPAFVSETSFVVRRGLDLKRELSATSERRESRPAKELDSSVSSTRDTARCRHLGDFGTRGELVVSDVGTAASEKVMPDGRTEGLGDARAGATLQRE